MDTATPTLPLLNPPRSLRRIWIFEDHQCFRQLLADFLHTLPDTEVVGNEDDEEQLFAAVDAGLVDLVMLDLNLRGAGGFRVMERLQQRSKPPAVLILSGQATAHSLNTAIRLGAAGYLQKTAPLEEILPALEKIRQGGIYFGEGAARQLAERVASGMAAKGAGDLTQREVELLTRLAHGASAKELAAERNLSRFTIYKMRTQLMRKIGADTQSDLVTYALRIGLMDPALVK